MIEYYGEKHWLNKDNMKGGQEENEWQVSVTSNNNEQDAKGSNGTEKRSENRWMSARELGYWRIIMCTTCVSLHVRVMLPGHSRNYPADSFQMYKSAHFLQHRVCCDEFVVRVCFTTRLNSTQHNSTPRA